MKGMTRQARKATADLQKEMVTQVEIVYGAAALALHREHGWGAKRIINLLDDTRQSWNRCAKDPDMSMLRLLEEETGIEIRARGVDQGYRDLEYLNGEVPAHSMTLPQYIYMRRRQIPWVNPQITAALLLALNHKHGWSGVRDQRLLYQKDEIEASFKWNPKKICEACEQETGVNIIYEVNKLGAEDE